MLRVLGRNIGSGHLWVIPASLLPFAGHAVTVSQTETFTSGSSAGWRSGENASTQPAVVNSGGPAGSSDRYLSVVTSGTHNTQSRLVIFNTDDAWAGDYATPGVTALEMDLKNFGDSFGTPVTLQIRVALKEATGSTSAGYATKVAITLPDDGKWHHAVFSFRPEDFMAIGTPTRSILEVLTDPGEIRILHAIEPALKGDLVNGLVQMGIDNLVAVPEPTVGAILLTGAGVIASHRRRRRP